MKLTRLSWSWINTLSTCGQQFVFRYIEKVVSPPGFAMIRGRAVDDAVNQNLTHKLETGSLLSAEQVTQSASDAFDAATKDGYAIDGEYEGMDRKVAFGIAKDEVVGLAGYHAMELAPSIDPTGIQLKVEVPPCEALPVTLVGVLDLVDGEVVRDLKTKRKAPPKDMADTSGQLTVYDLLYRALKGQPPAGLGLDVLWQTPERKERKHARLETQRSVKDLQVFVNRANAARRSIEAEIFLPAPTDHWVCTPRFCGYTAVCPYFASRSRPTT